MILAATRGLFMEMHQDWPPPRAGRRVRNNVPELCFFHVLSAFYMIDNEINNAGDKEQ